MSEIVGFNSPKLLNESTLHLETIYSKINFKKWYFGHFYDDMILNEKFRCVYKEIVQI